MIDYRSVVPLLRAAWPTFEQSLEAAVEQNGEYIAAGHVVEHLIRLLDEGDTQSFPAVFGIVEWVLAEGDEDARRLVCAGFLDDLVNPGFYRSTSRRPVDFVAWLGPRARRAPAVRALLGH